MKQLLQLLTITMKKGLLVKINGVGDIDEIFNAVVNALEDK